MVVSCLEDNHECVTDETFEEGLMVTKETLAVLRVMVWHPGHRFDRVRLAPGYAEATDGLIIARILAEESCELDVVVPSAVLRALNRPDNTHMQAKVTATHVGDVPYESAPGDWPETSQFLDDDQHESGAIMTHVEILKRAVGVLEDAGATRLLLSRSVRKDGFSTMRMVGLSGEERKCIVAVRAYYDEDRL